MTTPEDDGLDKRAMAAKLEEIADRHARYAQDIDGGGTPPSAAELHRDLAVVARLWWALFTIGQPDEPPK